MNHFLVPLEKKKIKDIFFGLASTGYPWSIYPEHVERAESFGFIIVVKHS